MDRRPRLRSTRTSSFSRPQYSSGSAASTSSYACQDFDHDRAKGLNSIPQAFGLKDAFLIARLMHLTLMGLLVWLLVLFHLHWIAAFGVLLVGMLLLYEHTLISPADLRRMNAAFFTLNGIISVVYFVSVATDVLLWR